MDFTAAQPGTSYLQDQRFFTRLAVALAAVIVIGFPQWAFRGFVARHDATVLGRVHPGTIIAIGAVVASHGLIQWLAAMPAVALFAQAIAHGSGAA